MGEKSRIKSLSTRFLTLFKVIVFTIYTALFFGIVYFAYAADDVFMALNCLIYLYWLFKLAKVLKLVKRVEFDDDYLYVIQRRQDIMIPLQNIESIEIVTVGGVYAVNLYREDIVGKRFYFKPSMIYPFNYQAKDRLVNELRARILRSRNRQITIQSNALAS